MDQAPRVTKFDYFERSCRALALVAIPVVAAIGAYVIDSRLQEERLVAESQTVNVQLARDYVQLAVSVLRSDLSPENLQYWAVDTLNHYSEIPFPEDVQLQFLRSYLSELRRESEPEPKYNGSWIDPLTGLTLPVPFPGSGDCMTTEYGDCVGMQWCNVSCEESEALKADLEMRGWKFVTVEEVDGVCHMSAQSGGSRRIPVFWRFCQ